MTVRHRYLLVFLAFITSCRTAGSRTEPEPVIRGDSSLSPLSPQFSPRASWILQPDERRHRYRSSTISSIVMDQPSAEPRDSTTLMTNFTVSANRDSRGVLYSITVEGLSLTSASKPSPVVVSEFSSPISFTERLERGQYSLDPPADCNTQVGIALSAIQRSLVLIPIQLQRGQSWVDSTSTAACSGSIPVTLTALRHYRVMGEITNGTRKGLLLERVDKTSSVGEGSEGQHRIQLRTEGTGNTQILIDPLTGALLKATGANTTLVTVTTSGRSQRFTQTSREQLFKDND